MGDCSIRGACIGTDSDLGGARDFTCPVCDKPFVNSVLMSYNNFGYRPARDAIFRPPHAARRGVRICPHDLYASWEDRWGKLEKDDKQRLAELLKQPAVALTDQEKKIAATDAAKLRQSPWWGIWWTRTCDQVRGLDLHSEVSLSLSLFYAGDLKSSEPWIRELTKFYREQAIEELAAWLIPSFPRPDRDGDRSAAWSRHRIALQVLVERSSAGNVESREQLWKSIASDPRRLLAVHGTLEETPGAPGSKVLIQCGDTWAGWLRTLAADAAVGKLPEACRKEPDEYLELFKSFAPPGEDEFDAKWRIEVLLPRVIKAEADGQLPETKLSRSELAFALGELANEAGGNGMIVRKAVIRLLRLQSEPDKEMPKYGFSYALGELAKASARLGTKPSEIDG